MPPDGPFVLVVSESGIARGFTQVILRADGLETREAFTPEQVLSALRTAEGGARASPVLLIDAGLLGHAGPRGDVWGRLLRAHPQLPVVCLKLASADRAPAAWEGRVRGHVDAMEPRELVATVRSAARPRTRSVRSRRAAERSTG